MPVSAAVYANYCRELTRLSVWYARKRIVDGSSDFEDAFNKRVNIFRNTSYYTGDGHPANGDVFPQWRVLLDTVRPVFEAHIAAADTEVLEAKCLELFWPSIVERVENVGNPLPDMAERPYKSWSFDYRHEALNIHIDNTYRPASPLVEMRDDFAACLLRMLQDSQRRRPEIGDVRCGSWLNSAPAFSALFPQAWRASGEPVVEIGYTMGFWGQFTDRRGDFHARNGQRFRELGRLPYPCLTCRAEIRSVLDHLRSSFPNAVALNECLDVPGAGHPWQWTP